MKEEATEVGRRKFTQNVLSLLDEQMKESCSCWIIVFKADYQLGVSSELSQVQSPDFL